MRDFMCWIGWHKWLPYESTITRRDKYTVEAEIYCKHCGAEAWGSKDDYWY